jgi:hypothetical protein
LTRRDLRMANHSTKAPENPWACGKSDPLPVPSDPPSGVSRDEVTFFSVIRFGEMMPAMSFIAKRIEFLSVEIDCELTERNSPGSLTYNPHA